MMTFKFMNACISNTTNFALYAYISNAPVHHQVRKGAGEPPALHKVATLPTWLGLLAEQK